MEETSRVSQQMMRAFFTKTKLLGSLGFARFSKLLCCFFPFAIAAWIYTEPNSKCAKNVETDKRGQGIEIILVLIRRLLNLQVLFYFVIRSPLTMACLFVYPPDFAHLQEIPWRTVTIALVACSRLLVSWGAAWREKSRGGYWASIDFRTAPHVPNEQAITLIDSGCSCTISGSCQG